MHLFAETSCLRLIHSQKKIAEHLLCCYYLISASLVGSQVQAKPTLNYLVKDPSAAREQME